MTPVNAMKKLIFPDIQDFYTVYETEECGSTSTWLKERERDLPAGFVLIARRQSAGRGRQGRSFFSPGGTGLYMSVLLRPALTPKNAALLTPAAAVAAARAVEACFPVRAAVKWVNDLYVDGRKVCGILAESALGNGPFPLRYAVLGAGFNIAPPEGGFPAELADVAGAITERCRQGDRERLAAAFLRELYPLLASLPETPFLEDYRARCFLTGREVTVLNPAGPYPALVLGVEDDFSLRVRRPDGREERLAAGDVSVRG